MIELLSNSLLQNSLLAVLLAGVSCGIVGSVVVVRRMASLSGGLSHAAFGGVGLGYLLGIGPMSGACIFSVVCAVILGFVYRKQREGLDTLISMLWSLGMAVGMVALAFVPGGAPDLSHFLFGSILFVPKQYLLALFLLDLTLLLAFLVAQREFLAVAFDEEFSEVRGMPVTAFFFFLLIALSLSVVLLMKVSGVILTIALLTTPAVIARQWTSSLVKMMALSTLVAITLSISGLLLTFWISDCCGRDLPTGPLIILLLMVAYCVSTLMRRFQRVQGLR